MAWTTLGLVGGESVNLLLQQMQELTRHVDNFAARRYNASFALSIKTLS